MSYTYKQCQPAKLEEIAATILTQVPHRIIDCCVDIEGIIEDFGITIIPRSGDLHALVDGYTPQDPHYIVLADAYASYPPRYRAIAAEEFSHIILEHEIYQAGTLPPGAESHELAGPQRQQIETDARYLAAAILFPKNEFTSRFAAHKHSFESIGGDAGRILQKIIALVAADFKITEYTTARRARDLGLITDDEFTCYYTSRLQF